MGFQMSLRLFLGSGHQRDLLRRQEPPLQGPASFDQPYIWHFDKELLEDKGMANIQEAYRWAVFAFEDVV